MKGPYVIHLARVVKHRTRTGPCEIYKYAVWNSNSGRCVSKDTTCEDARRLADRLNHYVFTGARERTPTTGAPSGDDRRTS